MAEWSCYLGSLEGAAFLCWSVQLIVSGDGRDLSPEWPGRRRAHGISRCANECARLPLRHMARLEGLKRGLCSVHVGMQ